MNVYNKTEDGGKWPIVLLDLSKQDSSSKSMTPSPESLNCGFEAGTRDITSGRLLKWVPAQSMPLTQREWHDRCR